MQDLLLLHGAIGAAGQLRPIQKRFDNEFKVHNINLSGHGGVPFLRDIFSIEDFAKEIIQYLDQNKIDKTSIFGYSMGGYIALYLAKHYPARVEKIITLATKFHWTSEIAEREIKMLNPEKIARKLPEFASSLGERHSPNDWKEVLLKTSELMKSLGNHPDLAIEDYKKIGNSVLVMIGDRDKMVTLEETLTVVKHLPNAQMAVIPNTSHPIEKVNAEVLERLIRQFLRS